MRPRPLINLLQKIGFYVVLIGVIAGLVWWHNRTNPAEEGLSQPSSNQSVAKNKKPTVATFDKTKYSTDSAASLWAVVNKGRALPSNYAPQPLRAGLRQDAVEALDKLFADAKAGGLSLKLYSGYRSYNNQVGVYAAEVKSNGQTIADRQSARAGHSEHQTGLAADISSTSGKCTLQACFGDTAEGKWLNNNSYKYGFIIRYQKDKENLTGYLYEPWHLRYVGVELAAEINKTGQTLEQFFGLPSYSNYPSNIFRLK